MFKQNDYSIEQQFFLDVFVLLHKKRLLSLKYFFEVF